MADSESEGSSESDDSDGENVDMRLYRGGDDALDRVLNILNEEENDDAEEFEGFLPDYIREPPLNFQNVEFDMQNLDYTGISGPRRVLDGSNTALDYFQLFFTDELFNQICEWTQKNATTKIERDPEHNKGKWTDITLQEMKAYFGIKLATLMSVTCPRLERYFCQKPDKWIFATPGFSKAFQYRRFIQISRYLHFYNDEMADKSDRLYKIRPYLDYLQEKFEGEYYPSQNVSIDECMVPFKGRLGIKQYIKDKPNKWGIKAFLLCDSMSAYCFRFEIYIARNSEFEGENLGLTAAVVLNLTKGMEYKGHIVYTDNFYTSVVLGFNLRARGIGMVGTIRCNRKGYPKTLSTVKDKQLQRGQFRYEMSDNMLACVWKDKRLVHFLSTVYKPVTVQIGRRNKQGVVENVNCPSIVQDYNNQMGGVDRNDQMCHLPKSAKQYKWYMRLALKAVLWAAYNAYILEGHVVNHKPPRKRPRDFQQFIDELIHALVGEHRAERILKRRANVENETPERLINVGVHFPSADEDDSTNHTCVVCTKRHHVYSNANGHVSRKDNPYRLTKTVFKCSECNIYLCVKRGSSCFKDYHTKVQYWR
ncbi:Hypothetical predicted protein [Mytilus galloprovincialis]|uniref:PiggyBac transposable element-derived protein domain-containing protein n=1 Tax=Mytilus galloprovincialis TaxID=29158 RepID=A0A8B6GY11_MYTGA|nr:Hypothetical predicted protein [Mytilus galloprovincialis]